MDTSIGGYSGGKAWGCCVNEVALEQCKDEIKFNGSPISDVISYDVGTPGDETAGEVHYYERHWSSQELIPDASDPTGYRTGRAKGKVEVVSRYVPPAPDYGDKALSDCLDQGWYPYGSPSYSQLVSNVSFVFEGFEELSCFDDTGRLTGKYTASVLNGLRVDGGDLGYGWTLISASEERNALTLAFVKITLKAPRSTIHRCHLSLMGVGGLAYEVWGYPHIYKSVRVTHPQMGNSAWSWSVGVPSTVEPWEPATWPSGSNISLGARPQGGVSPNILNVLRKLC